VFVTVPVSLTSVISRETFPTSMVLFIGCVHVPVGN
jgi:hypothetical protein